MSYTVHNFQPGDTLFASQLNEMDAQIGANQQDAGALMSAGNYCFTLQDGYLTASGTIGAADPTRGERTTNKILAFNGDKFIIDYEIPVEHAMWACYLLTDGANCPLKREIIVNEIGTKFSAEITISEENARYIAFSYRNYGDDNAFTVRSNNRTNIFESAFARYDGLAVSGANDVVKSINHRGYSTLYPENTALAFEKSAENGFKIVETDIQFTADGVPVCLHDNTINRTARNADGTALSDTISINDLTYQQALEYDFGVFKGSTFAGTRILAFEDFISLCRRLGLRPYIELKADDNYTASDYQKLVDIVTRHGMLRSATWISSTSERLRTISEFDPQARLGRVSSSASASVISDALSVKTAENEVFLDCKYSGFDSDGVARCIANHLALEVWTLDDPAVMRALDPYVSGCTSNRYAFGAVLAASA